MLWVTAIGSAISINFTLQIFKITLINFLACTRLLLRGNSRLSGVGSPVMISKSRLLLYVGAKTRLSGVGSPVMMFSLVRTDIGVPNIASLQEQWSKNT